MNEVTRLRHIHDKIFYVARCLKADFSEQFAHDLGDILLKQAEQIQELVKNAQHLSGTRR